MQKFIENFSIPFLLLFVLSYACNSDDDCEVLGVPPGIVFNSGTNFLTDDATLDSEEIFVVSVKATSGTHPLNNISINENGSKLSINRFTVDGSPATDNRLLVGDSNKNVATWEISITAQESGTSKYEFIVTDEHGLSESVSLTITVL